MTNAIFAATHSPVNVANYLLVNDLVLNAVEHFIDVDNMSSRAAFALAHRVLLIDARQWRAVGSAWKAEQRRDMVHMAAFAETPQRLRLPTPDE